MHATTTDERRVRVEKCPRYSNPSRRSPYLRAARAATRGSRRRRRERCRHPRKERRSSPKRYVLSVAPFFSLSPPSFFCIQGGTCVLESRRRSTTTRAREGAMDASPAVFRGRRRFEFDFGRRALVRIDGWTVLPAKRAARKDKTKTNFIRERLLQVFKEARKPSLFC